MASSSLSPQQKMDAWHNGTRSTNVKACSDEKLLNYYKICRTSGYVIEAEELHREGLKRGIVFPDIPLSKIDLKSEKNLEYLTAYITEHKEDINGRSGKDLVKTPDLVNGIIYYSWDTNKLEKLRSKNYTGFIIDPVEKIIWNENSTDSLNAPINYVENLDDALWFIDYEVFNMM